MTLNENKYYDSLEGLDTFESYYKNVIFRNNNLLIPYYNLGISEHPLNPLKELKFVDCCYVVLLNVTGLNVYIKEKRMAILNNMDTDNILYFGGIYLDFDQSIFNDLHVSCKQQFIQTLDGSKVSDAMWKLPLNAEKELNDLWSFRSLPNDVKDFFGL